MEENCPIAVMLTGCKLSQDVIYSFCVKNVMKPGIKQNQNPCLPYDICHALRRRQTDRQTERLTDMRLLGM